MIRRSRQTLAAATAALLATVTLPSTVLAAPGDAGPAVRVGHDAHAISMTVPAGAGAPGYTLHIDTDTLGFTTIRDDRAVLATAAADTGALRFHADGGWQRATTVTSWSWQDGVLHLSADSTDAGHTVSVAITPTADRYALSWSVAGASQLGLAYDLGSAGHWYGHGETSTPQGGPGVNQPWPLDAGTVHDSAFGPASYQMVDPFWFTQRGTGLYVDTDQQMDVALNAGGDDLGRFTVDSGDPYRATVFVERTPLAVYRDYIGIVGKPAKSDAPYQQYATPLWNSWSQFYTTDTQAKVLAWARGIHDAGLPGHTIQLDDRWESNYGNLTFDLRTFPDPAGMSQQIHDMGFDFGLWVTLWINLDSTNYAYAAEHGYLLKAKDDPGKPCSVGWWNGTAGIVDLANPAARDWYVGNLKKLQAQYNVDGFKFDTRFFDQSCRPDPGYTGNDYQQLGAQMADQFDLQGAGIRVHWTKAHSYGFVTRQIDKGTGWDSLAASVTQNLALSTIGYPFVETDMIGGSGGQPPASKQVLVRWAQSASLMPLEYASVSPLGVTNPYGSRTYDAQTVALYRKALRQHQRLAPYIWDQVQHTLRTGDPIMQPLFFPFPDDQNTYGIDDEWMLGPAVLAAPQLTAGNRRDVYLPAGRWYDVNRGRVVHGPTTLHDYPVPLSATPAFVRLGARGAGRALSALRRTGRPTE